MPTFYTVAQVAEMLKIRKNYAYDLIYTGRIKTIRLSERRFRITEAALQDFIKQEEEAHAKNISIYSGLQSTMEVD